jgi:hypothetical protein
MLAGTWGSNQFARATVHTVRQNSNIYEELELRLRTTIDPHNITGYGIGFRCSSDGSQYVQIVRWDGALANIKYLSATTGPGLHDGDVVMGTIRDSTITVYINGMQVLQATDSAYSGGSPGIGISNRGGTSDSDEDYGFTSFDASDNI